MSQDHTNDLYTVISYKINGLKAVHYKFAIAKSTAYQAIAASPAADGDAAMAAFIMVRYDTGNNDAALHQFTRFTRSTENDSRRAVVYDGETKSRCIMGSKEPVGVFSHFAHIMQ